jgi:site-specific DNA-methyltransferase (adenine-specific)
MGLFLRERESVSYARKEVLADGVVLYQGDCLEVLRTLDSVDHVISDPPYEQLMHDLHASTKLRRIDGGNERAVLTFAGIDEIREPFIEQIKRINNGWLLAFCNVEGVWFWRKAIVDGGLKFKTTCIWNKPDATPKLNGQGPALSYECITTTWCGFGHARWNGGGKRGVFTHCTNDRDRTGLHPTEKPVPLMRELVGLFSNYGDSILDPFMGSGTTGVAAVKMGRKFIGIELEPKYFDISCKRISAALNQPDFFVERPAPARQEKLAL